MVVIALVYVLIFILAGQQLIKILYCQEYYSQFLWLIPYLGVLAIIGAAQGGFGIALKAAKRPDAIFWSQGGGSLATLTIGIFLLWQWGIRGAAIGYPGKRQRIKAEAKSLINRQLCKQVQLLFTEDNQFFRQNIALSFFYRLWQERLSFIPNHAPLLF